MGLNQKSKSGNKKWLALCLGSCCLCGALSGAAEVQPKKSFWSKVKDFFIPIGKQMLSGFQDQAMQIMQRQILQARQRVGASIFQELLTHNVVDTSATNAWSSVAHREAESRWRMLVQIINQFGGEQRTYYRQLHGIESLTDAELMQKLRNDLAQFRDRNAQEGFLSDLPLAILFDLWNSFTNAEILSYFPLLPEFFRSSVYGHLAINAQTLALADQLLAYLPVEDRVLYFVLLSQDFQKASFYFLPLQIQEKLKSQFKLQPAQLLDDSEKKHFDDVWGQILDRVSPVIAPFVSQLAQ
ncbi:MAG: hypothetical protein K2L24_01765 [Opitutales bacterium]|nr:hypothetical protein [Opitutales bacterium]